MLGHLAGRTWGTSCHKDSGGQRGVDSGPGVKREPASGGESTIAGFRTSCGPWKAVSGLEVKEEDACTPPRLAFFQKACRRMGGAGKGLWILSTDCTSSPLCQEDGKRIPGFHALLLPMEVAFPSCCLCLWFLHFSADRHLPMPWLFYDSKNSGQHTNFKKLFTLCPLPCHPTPVICAWHDCGRAILVSVCLEKLVCPCFGILLTALFLNYKKKPFPLKSGIRERCLTSINTVFESSKQLSKKKKEN